MTDNLKKALSNGFCLAKKYLANVSDENEARQELFVLYKSNVLRFGKNINGQDLIIKNENKQEASRKKPRISKD